MTSINKKRLIIQRYVDGLKDVSPLKFVTYGCTSTIHITMDIPEETTMKDYLLEIICMSQNYSSCSVDKNRVETHPGRLRSAIDIWRHLKTVKPDIDIFTVMETLYKIRNKLYGHYCSTVYRTVFKPSTGYNGDIGRGKDLICEEFEGILFTEWRALHYARKPRKGVKKCPQ